ncbi:hypothetical protein JAAARDRAFT_712709 [Jaapia argillacea MUCL 33604]|uniref:Uncharacterized protein n=1 Tax=Jaapia argillacea MUCL 33604 TaxID=933084 RepID=A0A067P4Z6_9AGAM|nr:hypothetical protein JAAARDRAFT_712709 [Jaapia argillacea MUCL 33604]
MICVMTRLHLIHPFTNYFPRADIHELITLDILHQLIKGTFKDHLVTWVEQYIIANAESEHAVRKILSDIDRRCVYMIYFPGLRRFMEGQKFKQWTGNDSKALMKVHLSRYVPDDMVYCISVFLDFCYLARRSGHDSPTLDSMTEALERFHHYHTILEEIGIRLNGFSLPRQHSVVRYVKNVKLFSSPNGLCSSITESKHIPAVKKPWRRSNRNNPLGEMICTNIRLGKLAAARVEFRRRGMLESGSGLAEESGITEAVGMMDRPLGEDREVLNRMQRMSYSRPVHILADELNQPLLLEVICHFLYDQLYPDNLVDAANIPLHECPQLWPSFRVQQRKHHLLRTK